MFTSCTKFTAGLITFVIASTWLLLLFWQAPSCAADTETVLFSCETERRGKFLGIYGVEQGSGELWKQIQYRFGREGVPEMVFPNNPGDGAQSLFFSHEERGRGGDYRVSIRFTNGGYTYRLYSHSGDGGAGVRVHDSKGREVSRIRCIERPYMFPAYLQRSLACDEENPYGRAACGERPYRSKR
jgi:hypothetical protein